MKSDLLITGVSQLVTAVGAEAKRGLAMREVKVLEQAAVSVSGGRIAWVGKASEWRGDAETTVDVGGAAMVPGLIDPHTHAVWAGDRLADFEARAQGATYEQILKAGGGIRSTVRALSLIHI